MTSFQILMMAMLIAMFVVHCFIFARVDDLSRSAVNAERLIIQYILKRDFEGLK